MTCVACFVMPLSFRLRTHQYIILPENPAEVPQWLDLDLQHVQSGDKVRCTDTSWSESGILGDPSARVRISLFVY